MCGRFLFDAEFDDFYHRLMGYDRELKPFKGDYRPGQKAAVILQPTDENPDLQLMQWGLTNPVHKGLVINARSEGLREKGLFKPLLSQRCLIPATRFYESETRGKVKIPHLFGCGEPLLLAGLYQDSLASDVPRFTIITRAAEGTIRPYHDRMPIHIALSDAKAWLRGDLTAALDCLNQPQPRYALLDNAQQLSFF